MFKRILTIIAVVFITIAAAFSGVCFGWKLLGFKTCIDPASIKLEYIDADDDYITLKGSVTASNASFLGYIYEIRDRNVYIGLHYNKISGYFNNNTAFELAIKPDTFSFSEISGIYIKNEADERLVWEKDPEIVDPEKFTALSGDDELSGYDEYKQLTVQYLNYSPELIPRLRVYQAETGNLAAGLNNTAVILLGLLSEDNPFYYTPLIFIDAGNETLCKELINGAYFTEFYLADIDGDRGDEIIIYNETEAKSESNSRAVSIFKWENGDLVNIFYHNGNPDVISGYTDTAGNNANSIPESRDNAGNKNSRTVFTLDTGFELVLSDSFLYTIENRFTDFSITFVRQNLNPYFEEDGNLTDVAPLINNGQWDGIDPCFNIFKPVDYNNDGIFEIMAAQYCSLWGRADNIGTAYSLMQWDNEKYSFDIIKSDFWVSEDYSGHREQANYAQKKSVFERSWYYN
ncbi:MAG: hypothetical protein LBR98_04935 [Syntrophomonadaceae bacterium]|jgi:hypothetical protein|nr:hypothetical protein [Syntrophomonadaceae bacterium]